MEITADWTDSEQRERQQKSTVLIQQSLSFNISAPFDWYVFIAAAFDPYLMDISHAIKLKDHHLVIEAHFTEEQKHLLWFEHLIIMHGLVSWIVLIHCRMTLITESVLPFHTSWLNEYWHATLIMHSEPTLMKITNKINSAVWKTDFVFASCTWKG